MGDGGGDLPPGFRFYPTDEELVVHFLHRPRDLIPDLHLFPYDPWDLQGKAFSQDRKCYFYSRRSTHTRITQSGHWKPVGLDEPIFSSCRSKLGFKKSFVFYTGHPDQPSWSTNWIMHEYRRLISDASPSTTSSTKPRSKSDHSRWVICKVYEQTPEDDDANHHHHNNNNETELSCLDEVFLSMDDYDEISFPC